MIIPKRLQFFDHKVSLSDEDYQRLKLLSSGWNLALSNALMAMTEEDLERLLIIELLRPSPRRHMTDRFTARLGVSRKKELRAKVEALLL